MVATSIRAIAKDVRVASAWLERAGCERGVPEAQVRRLEICLNEALANILDYGGAAAVAAPIGLHLEVRGGECQGEAWVTVSDAGIAFDPVAAQPLPLTASLEEAKPGGLGLTMIHRFSDQLRYHHAGGQNHLAFGFRWSVPG